MTLIQLRIQHSHTKVIALLNSQSCNTRISAITSSWSHQLSHHADLFILEYNTGLYHSHFYFLPDLLQS